MDVGSLISGSSAFSKFNLYIWKFLVHVLLKHSLKDFEHNLTNMQNKYNCIIVWTFFGNVLLWDWNENWPFPVLWSLLSFPICLHIECSTSTASSFKILNNSTGVLSPPLALFAAMLPKAHLTLYSRMPGSRWVTTLLWLSGSVTPFLYSSSMYSCHPYLISSTSVRPLLFLSFIVPILAWNIPGGAWNDISSFLEEISNFSHSVVFLYFFALFIEEGLLVSSCYSLDLCIQLDISFPFSLAFRFSYFLSYL